MPFEQTMTGKSESTTSAKARAAPRTSVEGVTITAARARSSVSRYESVATISGFSSTSLR